MSVQRGSGLLELMLAVSLSLMLVLSAIVLLHAANAGFIWQEQSALMQDSAAVATKVLPEHCGKPPISIMSKCLASAVDCLSMAWFGVPMRVVRRVRRQRGQGLQGDWWRCSRCGRTV